MAQHTYTGVSPIKVPEGETIVSVTFPTSVTSVTALNIPDTAKVDVSACSDTFVQTILANATFTNKISTASNKIYYTATAQITPYSTSALPTISTHTFSDGKGVITFADSVTSIGKQAFQSCKSLTSVTIPDSVTSIGEATFLGCTGITSITIPDSVASIEKMAFYMCTGLTSVTYKNTEYTSISALTTALTDNGVTLGTTPFAKCNSFN